MQSATPRGANLSEGERLVSATCRTCQKQLTVDEFRTAEARDIIAPRILPAQSRHPQPPRPRSSASTGARKAAAIADSMKPGRQSTPCKAQFASDGVIRRGRLTCDHPACSDGSEVFVVNDVPYTPTEIVTLFIRDPDGRRIAQGSGFNCHD